MESETHRPTKAIFKVTNIAGRWAMTGLERDTVRAAGLKGKGKKGSEDK